MKRFLLTFGTGILPALILIFGVQTTQAGPATWKLNPVNHDWYTDANWTPMQAPVLGGTAIFESSNITNISLKSTGRTTLHGITFNPGASAFTINISKTGLVFHDGGITNNSGVTQNFVVNGGILFRADATAGNLTFFHVARGMQFRDRSSADNGTFEVDPGALIFFFNGPTAGNATFTNNGRISILAAFVDQARITNNGGAVSGAAGGELEVSLANAGTAVIINNGGTVAGAGSGRTDFHRFANADNSTLIANGGVNGGEGGSILVRNSAQGGNARVELFGNGSLDVSQRFKFPDVSFGSIEGSGMIFLGASTLHTGSNTLSTTFSGVIRDQGGVLNVKGGSLSKEGFGTLTLTNANRYTGGTLISEGILFVGNTTGSATGFGPVQVDAGVLGGEGIIAGAVTVGTGSGSGAFLVPAGRNGSNIGTLSLASSLNFKGDATFEFNLNSSNAKADEVVASGVGISGARFSFADVGSGKKLGPGTVFTVIENTSATAIAGTFSNLADGATFTSRGNTFQANYEGGDGNDLTLTVQ